MVQDNTLDLKTKLLSVRDGNCLYCVLVKDPTDPNPTHLLSPCPHYGDNNELYWHTRKLKEHILGQRLVKPHTACFKCLLPRNICDQLRQDHMLHPKALCYFKSYMFEVMGILAECELEVEFILGTELNVQLEHQAAEFFLRPINIDGIQTINLVNILNTLDTHTLLEYELELVQGENEEEEEETTTTEQRPGLGQRGIGKQTLLQKTPPPRDQAPSQKQHSSPLTQRYKEQALSEKARGKQPVGPGPSSASARTVSASAPGTAPARVNTPSAAASAMPAQSRGPVDVSAEGQLKRRTALKNSTDIELDPKNRELLKRLKQHSSGQGGEGSRKT